MEFTLTIFLMVCTSTSFCSAVCYKSQKLFIVNLSIKDQTYELEKAKRKCEEEILESTDSLKGSHCNMTFDGVMCWTYAEAGRVVMKKCPRYTNGFNTQRSAKKTCLSNEQWYINEATNRTWTDYTDCLAPPNPSIVSEHIPKIKLLYNVGYAISLVSLFLAVIIMIVFKRLHCEKNIIHLNLFISFILRATICFVKDVEFIPEGEVFVHNDNFHVKSQGASWGCKLLYTIFHYLLTANYAWIFIEGVYLHILIFEAKQHKKKLFRLMVILGWCSPLLCVLPWAAVRAIFEDSLCWSTHDPDKGIYWIIKGPIVTSIFINFFLFINVIRVLFTKLTAYNIRNPKRYRKLARATLVLIPLFGVHYITFIAIPNCLDDHYQIIRLYIEMTLNSFQGFVVALLFCFLNREVRGEFRKKWRRHLLKRQSLSSSKSYRSQTEVIKMDSSPEMKNKILKA